MRVSLLMAGFRARLWPGAMGLGSGRRRSAIDTPAEATHSSTCAWRDRIFGDLRDPEARLAKAIRGRTTRRPSKAQTERDRQYREVVDKAGIESVAPSTNPAHRSRAPAPNADPPAV